MSEYQWQEDPLKDMKEMAAQLAAARHSDGDLLPNNARGRGRAARRRVEAGWSLIDRTDDAGATSKPSSRLSSASARDDGDA